MKPIYLDYNATTPIAPEVAAAMRPYLEEHFGNPSSSHWYGIQTKKAVEHARKQVAGMLGCGADEVIFTSGGSEANNYAITGTAFARRNRGNHIITSAIEHPAVLKVCDYLETQGFVITRLPVDEFGLVSCAELEQAITPQTILITIMHANNEVGTLQPIAEIAAIARARGIVMHTDAAQSVGKVDTRVAVLGVDLLSIAGHKVYAPKGIGALYIRNGVALAKLIHGADHEQNRRAGTENVLEIVGLGQACEIAGRDLARNAAQMKTMRDRLYGKLHSKLEDLRLNGHPDRRLPNTLSVSFPHIEANTLLSELTEVAASAGAACHADSIDVSHVLEAMNVPQEYAMGTVRLSVGKMTTAEEVDRAAEIIAGAVARLRPAGTAARAIPGDSKEIKLTQYTHGLGCACKMRPQILEEILSKLPRTDDKNILVGTDTADDAAVYRINDQTAIVQTVDFFTPVVDDPYWFGAIAAANALSDIYAMGARPLFALNIVGFPSNRLPGYVLEQILQGAQDKASEAGVSIIGGHTVEDPEPKYGLAVTGIVSPDKILINAGAQPGDVLILTKPLGVGILTTAMKRGLLEHKTAEYIIALMAELNRAAAEVIADFPVNACTDVTGFGLLGHLKEMVEGSKVGAMVYAALVPKIAEALEFAAAGVVPGGTMDNMQFVVHVADCDEAIGKATRTLLCDAQTSGGLLISLPAAHKDTLLNRLHEAGVTDAAYIGDITTRGRGHITVK
jgi:cysteine desulfurase NifS/selenium donor protein